VPGMTAAQADDEWVQGVVYELDDPAATLALLERYEGCAPESPQPWLFARCRLLATLDAGTDLPAWIYLDLGPLGATHWIPPGDWVRQRQASSAPTGQHRLP